MESIIKIYSNTKILLIMKYINIKLIFSTIVLTSFFNIQDVQSGEYKMKLEHLACYSSNPSFRISPSGKYMAIITRAKDNECDIHQDKTQGAEDGMFRRGLRIIDLDTWESRTLSDGSQGEGVDNFMWVSNDRFLYWTNPFLETGKEFAAYTVFAMNIDGSQKTELLNFKLAVDVKPNFGIYDMDYSDPKHIYIYMNNRRPTVPDFYKLNVFTGKPQLIAFGPDFGRRERMWDWGPYSDGTPAYMITDIGIDRMLYTFNKESKKWEEHYTYRCQTPHFTPIAVTDDDLWLVSGQKLNPDRSVADDHDTNAIYIYDPNTKEFSDKLFEDPDYDIGGYTGGCRPASGGASVDPVSRKLTYVGYTSYKPERIYFDDEAGTRYKAVKQVFPNDYVSFTTSSHDKKRSIVNVWGSDNPGDYYYLDMNTGELKLMWQNSPWIDRSITSKKQPVKYIARDGLEIPAYFSPRTFDAGGNYFIINPHGGPNVKEGIGWDNWVQFLTSRGFNVLQPDYRGSTGNGREHYMLGNKQWGKTMQDDLTDGVQWAIDNGYADEDKVCIAGGSYGGYAAMAGAVFTPNVYSCVINFVGVADMRDLLRDFGSGSSTFNSWEDEGRLEWGDDRGPDGEKYINEISPLLHVKNIQAPVLISHGANDYVVPIEHARKLRREMEKHNKVYEWHIQAYEGHGFGGELARLEHMQVQQEFFEKYMFNKKK